jgi:endonuclease III
MKIETSIISTILETLKSRYPIVRTQLEHASPFQLLIAVILSAQCTDRQVNKVTPILFSSYPDPESMANAPLKNIRKIVYSTGFYKHKSKYIKACAKALIEEHKGVVPENRESLVKLPGVGRKTANVVLSAAFGWQTIVVDTHVLRISNRLGLTENKDPVAVEQDLMAIIPEQKWNDFSLQLIYFGREICDARKPLCQECPLKNLCPSLRAYS